MSDNNDNELFTMTSDERSELVNKLSDKIIIGNIESQLTERMLNNIVPNNLLSIFNDRYNFITRFYNDDEELINRCKEIRKEIYMKIFTNVVDKFDISTELEEANDTEDFYFFVEELYKFFIINYKKNLITFFEEYIKNRAEYLIDEYKDESEKKDLMFKSFKKILNNSEYIHIMYNLESIILNYIDNTNDPDYIIDTLLNLDEYELTINTMGKLFIENQYNTYLTNDFSDNFFKPFLMEEYKFDLLAEIRNDLIIIFKELDSENEGE